MTTRDYAAIARDYATDVTQGRILACRFVRLACIRHLDGLRQHRTKSYLYKLDAKAATKVCRFVELLPHVKGKWAREKESLRLEPWQCFILVNVFGWLRKSDGLRRYRKVYIEVPRKNAKSTLTAAVGNYMLVADNEMGAEVYSGATSEKQAWEVFGPARLMAERTDELKEHFGVDVGAKNLSVKAKASKFEPIIGKPGDGASPSFSITDEYHEHVSSEQYDTMVTGMGSREQPIAWVITTAGSDTAGPCYLLRTEAVEILEGKVAQDEFFALIYTIDLEDKEKGAKGVSWTSDAALRMANPNLGVSVGEEFLKTERQSALNHPHKQATFKTKHLNLWVTAAAPYFDAERWNQLADPTLTEEAFVGEPCVIAFDLASKLDIVAKVKLFRRMIDEGQLGKPAAHYYAFAQFYVPQTRVDLPENKAYAGWVADGHLLATPGDITDYDYIEADIKADAEKNPVQQIGGDPWNATQVITHLQGVIGADKVIEVPQTVAHLSEPMKEVQAAIVAGRMHHNGNPVFAWCIGNVTAQVDRNDNVFPRKERPEKKIDGALALIIATGCALRMPAETGSVYENRGVIVL